MASNSSLGPLTVRTVERMPYQVLFPESFAQTVEGVRSDTGNNKILWLTQAADQIGRGDVRLVVFVETCDDGLNKVGPKPICPEIGGS